MTGKDEPPSFTNRTTRWSRVYYKSSEEPDRKKRNRQIRADLVLDQQKCDVYTSEYIEDSPDLAELDRTKRRSEAARIKGYFERILAYSIPFVIIEPEVGLGSICRVFETINSTGSRPTTFDLAVARFFPKPDLRELTDAAKERAPLLSRYDVDGDRILQIVATVRADRENRVPEPSRSELLRLPGSRIEQEWDLAVDSMVSALEWASRNGARRGKLPNFGILVSLAAFMRLFPDEDRRIDKDRGAALGRWYFSRLLRPGARVAANWPIGRDFVDLVRHKREGSPLTFEEVRLSEQAIVEMPEQDNRFNALRCIMASSVKTDLLTGNDLMDDEIEEHHIFPRSQRAFDPRRRKLYDSIANRTLLLKSTNRALSNERPRVYIERLIKSAREAGVVEGLRARLREHLVPWSESVDEPGFADRFEERNFEQFLRERAGLLLQKVRETIGESLLIRSDAGPEAEEGEVEE